MASKLGEKNFEEFIKKKQATYDICTDVNLSDIITCSNIHRMGGKIRIRGYSKQAHVHSIKFSWNLAASCKAILIFPKICSFSFKVSRV